MSVPADSPDESATLTYSLVVVTEIVVIAMLWLIQRVFGPA